MKIGIVLEKSGAKCLERRTGCQFLESDKEASSEAAFAKLPQGGSESAEYVCFLQFGKDGGPIHDIAYCIMHIVLHVVHCIM